MSICAGFPAMLLESSACLGSVSESPALYTQSDMDHMSTTMIIQGRQKKENVTGALIPSDPMLIITIFTLAARGAPVRVLWNKNQLASVRGIREEACLVFKKQCMQQE